MVGRTSYANRAYKLVDQIYLEIGHIHAGRMIPLVTSTNNGIRTMGHTVNKERTDHKLS